MTKMISAFSLAAALAFAAVPASAAVIDFTSAETGLSGTADGVTWTVTASTGVANNTQAFDGASMPASSLGLAFEQDGLGIVDDEVGLTETLTLMFSEPVRFVSYAVLDLFANVRDVATGEVAMLTVDGTDYDLSFVAGAIGGYAELLLPVDVIASVISFTVRNSNDNLGVADAAFAAVSFETLPAPVPVPASALMLIAGLGGIAALRRKRA